jgi:hypothetical protein
MIDEETQTACSFPPCCAVVTGWSVFEQPHLLPPHGEIPVAAAAAQLVQAPVEEQIAIPPDAAGAGTNNAAGNPLSQMRRQRVLAPQLSDAVDEGAEHFDIASCAGDDAPDIATGPQIKPAEYIADWSLDQDEWVMQRLVQWRQTFKDWRKVQRDWKDATRRTTPHAGSEAPQFSCFTYEDWALLNIRIELYLLLLALQRGADDPGNTFISTQHLPIYNNKFFLKRFTIDGFKEFGQLEEIINNTVVIKGENVFIQPELDHCSDFGLFVQHTETHLRARRRRVDNGDESGILNFAAGLLP